MLNQAASEHVYERAKPNHTARHTHESAQQPSDNGTSDNATIYGTRLYGKAKVLRADAPAKLPILHVLTYTAECDY